MNNSNSEITAEPVADKNGSLAPNEREPRRGGSGLAVFAFLLALAALAATAWLWWQAGKERSGSDRLVSEIARLESSDEQLAKKLQKLSGDVTALSAVRDDDRLSELQERLSGDRQAVDALQQTVQEQTAVSRSLQAAMDSMHTRLRAAEAAQARLSARELDARGALDLAEVDYLLRLASERLQLFSDAAGADHALALADSHLAALGSPSFLAVRQAIAASRRDLAAVERPDEVAIAAGLDSVQEAIAGLPLRGAPTAADTAAIEEAAGWWEKLKQTFASLVTVRRSTGDEGLRISLQDEEYIRQRLWLQVEFARLASMRRDPEAWADSLSGAADLLERWFDPASPAVAPVQSLLQDLSAMDLAVEWPDISEPWTLLRQVRSAQGAVPPAPPAGESAAEPASPAEGMADGEVEESP